MASAVNLSDVVQMKSPKNSRVKLSKAELLHKKKTMNLTAPACELATSISRKAQT
jgi:hypothetical protein